MFVIFIPPFNNDKVEAQRLSELLEGTLLIKS